MAKRRSRGDGGLHWDNGRQRWIATAHLGFTPAGKRITKKGSGRTKTEAKNKLKEVLRDLDDGIAVGPHGYKVADAVEAWLTHGLSSKDRNTVKTCRHLAAHMVTGLGHRTLRELTADEVDEWLASLAPKLSTSTLQRVLSILRRVITRAQARDKVKRNVALLCEAPKGKDGRPSRSLNLAQAEALLNAAEGTTMHAYIVVSLLTGARTEELRAVRWIDIDLDGDPNGDPVIYPSIAVWRSVRAGGDTKNKRSRRTLRLPRRCIATLRAHREAQNRTRANAGTLWQDTGLVFTTSRGTALDAANVRRSFRRIVKAAGLSEGGWTPRELRHSFVSLLSAHGVKIEDISRLLGHKSTLVTETVYRHELRPILTEGAEAMDIVLAWQED